MFFMINWNMQLYYFDMGDGIWVYFNSIQLVYMSFIKMVFNLFVFKNDIFKLKEMEDKKEKFKIEEVKKGEDKGKEKIDKKEKLVVIDFDDLEVWVCILFLKVGNFGGIMVFDGKLVFVWGVNIGLEKRGVLLQYFDLKERVEKIILVSVGGVVKMVDGKVLLVSDKGKYGIVKFVLN